MGSTRLPNKVLMPLGGVPVLEWVVRACEHAMRAGAIDQLIVATTTEQRDNAIEAFCKEQLGVACVRGSENDVLSRHLLAAQVGKADTIFRVTADEPFIDPAVIAAVSVLQQRTCAHYCSNIHPRTYPDGIDVECFSRDALEAAHKEATRPIDRECVTSWIMRNQSRFPAECLINPIPSMADERWVLDTMEDYEFCQHIAEAHPFIAGPPSYLDILNMLSEQPDWRKINASGVMNERYFEALAEEGPPSRSYTRSRYCLAKAEQLIPLGAQTFSKSKLQFPADVPHFVSHGQGGVVWDVDGNEYVDMVGCLLPNILGYRDPDVDESVRRQLSKGISFSLATELEAELAEKLVGMIPSAEMVRFGKTGTDVTSAAIRLARAYTKREYVIMFKGGYHGWADWSVANDPVRDGGVPSWAGVGTWLTEHSMEAVRQTDMPAAIIIEPEGDPEFLKQLRTYCDEIGAVLIFDEVITWPRWHLRGAQYLYGVTPDLTCISKGIANGMPLSALVGKRPIMKHMAPPDNIFFSGTFFGETLSLAAGLATINKLERAGVIDVLQNRARDLQHYIGIKREKHGVDCISFDESPITRIKYKDRQTQDIFLEAMLQSGTLIINSNNLCYAHKETDIRRVLKSYDIAFATVAEWQREKER